MSGGENVYPAEVEDILLTHPAVAECAVIGVNDDRWGEVGHAVVVPATGAQADEEALLVHLRERLAPFKVPKSFAFRATLPHTASGKVAKTALRENLSPLPAAHPRRLLPDVPAGLQAGAPHPLRRH